MEVSSNALEVKVNETLVDYEDIQTFESERFEQIRNNPEELFNVTLTDAMFSGKALGLMFMVGGYKWLKCLFNTLEVLDPASVPARYLNIIDAYRESGEFALCTDFLDMLYDNFVSSEEGRIVVDRYRDSISSGYIKFCTKIPTPEDLILELTGS